MREVKFRAWDKDSSRWIENFAIVHTGSNELKSIYNLKNKDCQKQVRVFEVNYKKEYEGHGNSYHYDSTLDSLYGDPKIKNVILQQYTGLRDKNGKGIFEGDIIKVEFDANIIKLSDGRELMGLGAGPSGYIERRCENIVVKFGGLSFNHFTTINMIGALGNETLEVIGNIFENPDLF